MFFLRVLEPKKFTSEAVAAQDEGAITVKEAGCHWIGIGSGPISSDFGWFPEDFSWSGM